MQSYDDNDQIISADYGGLESLVEKIQTETRAKYHVIGELPKRGEEVTINGLVFNVLSFNNKKGTVHLKLKGEEGE